MAASVRMISTDPFVLDHLFAPWREPFFQSRMWPSPLLWGADPAADSAMGCPLLWKDSTVPSSRDWPSRPHDSPVVSHERDLFSAEVTLKEQLSCRRKHSDEDRCMLSGRSAVFIKVSKSSIPLYGALNGGFLSVGHLHQCVRVFVSVFVVPPRRREAFYPPHPPPLHPSAAECLKYLTGTALFLGLCSVCWGAYVMEFQLNAYDTVVYQITHQAARLSWG